MGRFHPRAGDHLSGPFLTLDAPATGGTRFHDKAGQTLAWVKADIFPPVGTAVVLPNGSTLHVQSLYLDLSREDQIAHISVRLGATSTPGHPAPDTSTAIHSTSDHLSSGDFSGAVPATHPRAS